MHWGKREGQGSAKVGARDKTREETQGLSIPEASKRERVLDAAERLFAEGGFHGVLMRYRGGRRTLASASMSAAVTM
ncbi:hypothetical protein AWV79_17285 [Cupriavidus sp. UYMMa02A]|nr:hypothetical protein AWV79_17285 [Cupriavidus sp. UYMMa02A]